MLRTLIDMVRLAGKKTASPSALEEWKTLTTLLDGVVIEIRQLEHTIERRGWAVRTRPAQVLLRVWVTGRALKETPAGAQPHGRDWTDEEIERAIVYAVEKACVSPRYSNAEIIGVALTSYDLYSANGRL
jgi:hypothetical protein